MVRAMARRVGVPTLLALIAVLWLPHAAQALTWRKCPDFASIRCSTLAVPLDRTGVDPGTVPLRIARTGRTSGPTLMYLSGGPGGAGVSEMVGVMSEVDKLLDRYRVIGYDQRGTGRSGLLRCPAIERDPHLRSTAAAEACANTLGVRRHHYTTADSVQDMEAIRQAIGVDKLTLFGISYGTELALAYARTFPTHVNRLIIDSVVDPDDADPYFTPSFRNMAPSLRALCPSRCTGLSPDPAADLFRLVTALRTKPLHAFAYDSLGRSHRVTISPVALLDLMFQADYEPALRAAMPAAVNAALAGDGAPLARLMRQGDLFDDLGSPRDFSNARYAAVCEETPLPWDPGTPIDQRPAVVQQRIAALPPDTFSPFDSPVVVDDEIDLCLRWPDVPRPPTGIVPPPYPAVPTLLLQGAEDLRTPPEISARIAAKIPGSIRVVVPGVGHAIIGDDSSGCGERALVNFVSGRHVAATCKRVPTGVRGNHSPPASFAALAGVKGEPLKVGRTLRALAATVDDVSILLSRAILTATGGGLRGGSWDLRDFPGLHLRNYQAVPGVEVSGHLRYTDRSLRRGWQLRITGTNAAHGTIKLRTGGKVTGRLGGHKVRFTLVTSAASTARAVAAAAAHRPSAPAVRVP
jgi:pimeloyl-ACP methyl ester carboxylesterase